MMEIVNIVVCHEQESFTIKIHNLRMPIITLLHRKDGNKA